MSEGLAQQRTTTDRWLAGPVVLVITSSPAADGAVARWAADAAVLRSVPLLVSVSDTVQEPAAGAAFAASMGIIRAHAPGVPARAVPARSYGADARELAADAGLLVVAAGAADTPALAAETDCPLVAVPRHELACPDTAAVMLGVTPWTAEVVIDLAFAEAELRGAPLDAVRVWCNDTVDLGVPSADNLALFDAASERVTRELDLAVSAWSARHPTVDVRQLVIEDDPVPALLACAHRARLLVLGRSVRGPSLGNLVGSPLADLISNARCPVLVVPGDSACHVDGAPNPRH
ncbi:universal stress protein [Pseudonocardia acaciae]|uniref:universal stress protein n=1 Tax=Pseudonocardia acaciae TaxID=551276 RepID=UPI0004911ABA|nr:universal stress protein [Pseudonocardia acaciae]